MRTRLFATICLSPRRPVPPPSPPRRSTARRARPRNRATGENYHVEGRVDFWNPTPDIVISSESLGILGDQVDFVNTLGIAKTKFKQFKVVLRPGDEAQVPLRVHADQVRRARRPSRRRSSSTASATHRRAGRRPNVKWKAYRFGYE